MKKKKKKSKTSELHNLLGFAIGIVANIIIVLVVYLGIPSWYALGEIAIIIGYLFLVSIFNFTYDQTY